MYSEDNFVYLTFKFVKLMVQESWHRLQIDGPTQTGRLVDRHVG